MKLGGWMWAVVALVLLAVPGKARAQSGVTDRSATGVTCASDDGRRHYCPLNTSRGVQLVKQRSNTPCVQGQSWGYDRRGVWVDRGCRAEFAVTGYGQGGPGYGGPGQGGPGWNGPGNGRPGNGGPGYGGPGNGGPGYGGPGQGGPGNGWGQGQPGGATLTCSSDDGKRHYCQASTRGGVQLVNQRSGSPCVQGRTWGYDRRGVWVDRGCRADFAVGR